MSSIPFRLHCYGPFEPGQIEVHWQDTPRPTTPELEALIKEAWSAAEERCRRTGAMLFNGALLRCIADRVDDGVLHIDAGPSDYRDFLGTNLCNAARIAEFGRERYVNAIGISANVISRDGWIVVGRRGPRVAFHAGCLHPFGGNVEAEDVAPDGSIDVFAAIDRELREELRLSADEIESRVCLGIVVDPQIEQPELIFDHVVRPSRDELLGRLDHADAHQEHLALETLRDDPAEVDMFLRRAVLMTPVAVGALALHGRRAWGRAWYDERVARGPEDR